MTTPINIQWKAVGGSTVDISAFVKWDSIDSISVLTKERGTLQFQMLVTPSSSSKIPAVGDDIKLADSSGTIFGGTVTEVEKTVVEQKGGILLQVVLTVTDYGFVLDSQLVKTAYTNMDPADILAALVSSYGPGGYDAVTFVQRGGFNISTISFNYEQLTKCIEALAQQIGWDWYVDTNKAIHFFFATTSSGSSEYNPAPITIDDTSAGIEWPSLDVDINITNLKNSVYVIGGSYPKVFDATTTPDVYTTVAGQTIYKIGYKYTGAFFVTLDGVSQSIGIDQQDDPTLFQTLYNSVGPFIRFTADPGSGHTLKVYGNALIPIIAHVRDAASIAAYGEYQDAINDAQITSVIEAQARAVADLTLFGHPVYNVKFNTITTGLRVGQIILLNSTKFGVSNYPLVIKRVEAVYFTPTKLRYQIQAIGSDVVTFNDMMTVALQQQLANTAISPSTVIQVLEDMPDEAIATADTVSASGIAKTSGKWGSSAANSLWGFTSWQ